MSLKLPDLVILNGSVESSVLDFTGVFRRISNLYITSPATIGTAGSVKVYTANNPSGTFVVLQSNGSDISLTVSKGLEITITSFGAIKLVAASDPGQDLTFQLSGLEMFMGAMH